MQLLGGLEFQNDGQHRAGGLVLKLILIS